MNVSLEDWQWDIVDAEADACGVTRAELLKEIILEAARKELSDFDDDGTVNAIQH